MKVTSKDEVGELTKHFNDMVEQMNEMVSKIKKQRINGATINE